MIQRREDQTLFEECPAGILISEREEKGKIQKMQNQNNKTTGLSEVCSEYFVFFLLQKSNCETGLDMSEI